MSRRTNTLILALGELRSLQDVRNELERLERESVARVRRAGGSWDDVGTVLGIARQNAHRKYRGVELD